MIDINDKNYHHIIFNEAHEPIISNSGTPKDLLGFQSAPSCI